MEKEFDDLFNDDLFNDDFFKDIRRKFKEISDALNSMSDVTNKDLVNEKFEDVLGKPDEVTTDFDGEMYVKRLVWHTEKGDIVKVMLQNTPFEDTPESLEEQLQKAINVEDYETAAKLRDQIKSLK